MSLVGFTVLASYKLPTIPVSATDVVAVLKYSDFEAATLSKLDDGGGDLRFSVDLAGTMQLPCHVVKFDKVANDIVVKFPLPLAATGLDYYVWGDNTGATQPAVTDPFGRNAVYAGDFTTGLLNESASSAAGHYINSSGGTDGTAVNSTSGNGVDNPFGQESSVLNGTNQSVAFPISSIGNEITMTAWANADNFATDQRLMSIYNPSVSPPMNYIAALWLDIGGSGDGWALTVRDMSGTPTNIGENSSNATTDWQYIAAYISNSEIRVYVDGVLTDSVAIGSTLLTSTATVLEVGRIWDLSGTAFYFDGAISESRLRQGDQTSKLAIEYDNQSAVGAWGVMTPVSAGVSASITESYQDFTESITVAVEANVSAFITESYEDFDEFSFVNITPAVSIEASITESYAEFSETISVLTSEPGQVISNITESYSDFSETINAEVSVNLSVDITESYEDFSENINTSISKDVSTNITESYADFSETINIKLPVSIIVNPKNRVSVKRSINTVKINRTSNTVRVR